MAESTKQQQPLVVDETPIARPDNARKNSLNNHLMHRPERNDLIESTYSPPASLPHLRCWPLSFALPPASYLHVC